MGMLIGGVVLLILGIVAFFVSSAEKKKLAVMSETETFSVRDLERMAQGEGAEAIQLVEVKGQASCASPLTAPFSGKPCAYYHSSVEDKYEERYKDSDGEMRERTGYETRSQNEDSVSFTVNDGTGSVEIFPVGAQMDLLDVYDEYVPNSIGQGVSMVNDVLDVVGIETPVGGQHSWSGGRRIILGERRREKIFPVSGNLYVLGTLFSRNGKPVIAAEKGKKFILSTKSEEELTAAAASGAKMWSWICYLSTPIGLVLTIIGAMKHFK